MSKPIFTSSQWTFPLLNDVYEACKEIADEELGLTYYPNQIEVISSDQMLDAYASVGMPVSYSHWSFGKQAVREAADYRKGRSGLAYEIVINSDPTINYLMEENSMTMQSLVIAHAAFGHNSFFRNNYLFKEWTDAGAIVDYLVFAKEYIAGCESRHGVAAVERVLDACHSLQSFGVDKYRRPVKLSAEKEKQRRKERDEERAKDVNDLWDRIVPKKAEMEGVNGSTRLEHPQENLLYFLEKHSPILKDWEREIVRIVRKIGQYFYPQRQTQVMNEGWASTVHFYIMTRLHEKGLITDGSYLEFLHSHSGVLRQGDMTAQMNPYWLGFNIFSEIKRVCTEPTKEDEQWFPDLVGTDWLKAWHYAVENFRDESFIQQYMTPELIRKGRFFMIEDDSAKPDLLVKKIHDARGYEDVRQALAQSRSIAEMSPDIQVVDYHPNSDRHLDMVYYSKAGSKLRQDDAVETLRYVGDLWGFDVCLTTVDEAGKETSSMKVGSAT